MAVTKRTRYEVLARDNNTCRYCHATDTPLTIDHVIPTALGGSDDPSNLVAACKDCNAGKSSSNPDATLVEQVSDDTVRWAAAMKLAAERLNASKTAATEQTKPFHDAWFIHSGPGWSYRLPGNADEILIGYLGAGMPPEVLADAARIALRKRGVENYWHYFQGVAKNMLADLQRDAQALLAPNNSPGPEACGSCKRVHTDLGCWVTGYTIGYLDCSTMGSFGHPDHLVMYELSKVVDASAHAAFDVQLHPIYSARG